MSRGAIMAAVLGAAVLGGVGLMLVAPDTGPDIEEMQKKGDRKARRAAKAPRAEAPAAAGPEAAAKRGPRGERRRDLPPGLRRSGPASEVRLQALRERRELQDDPSGEKRAEQREQRLVDQTARARSAAEALGLDAETTAQVLDLHEGSFSEISEIMASVDRGEMSWEEAKPAMRDVREDQAEQMRGLLGDQGYDEFVARAAPTRAQVGANLGRLGGGLRPPTRMAPPAGP